MLENSDKRITGKLIFMFGKLSDFSEKSVVIQHAHQLFVSALTKLDLIILRISVLYSRSTYVEEVI